MYVIAGIDPGTTVGIAVVDLKGKVLFLDSKRDAGKEEAVRSVQHMGTPVIIACDKEVPPEFVLKVSAAFNARHFSPPHDLLQNEKERIVKDYDVKDDHQRDALASALKAYHHYENKFRQIDALPYSDEDKEKIKHFVVLGFAVHDALIFITSYVKEVEKQIEQKPSQRQKTIEEYVEKIRGLMTENMELRKALESERTRARLLESDAARAKKGASMEIMRDREIRKLNSQIARLRQKIHELNLIIDALTDKAKGKGKAYETGNIERGKNETAGRFSEKRDNEEKHDSNNLKILLERIVNEYRQKRQKQL